MFHSTTVMLLSVVLMLWLISVRAHVKLCMKYMYIISSTRIRVRVRPIQTSHTADDVEKVNGRPGKRHAKTAETHARLLCLKAQLL